MQKYKADNTPPFLQASVDRDEGMVGMEEEESPEEISEAAGLALTERQRQAEAKWAMQERGSRAYTLCQLCTGIP
jgi:hypothetical protein